MEPVVDPVVQIERWLMDYMASVQGRDFGKPPHSACLDVCRAMFAAEATLDDVENILRWLYDENVRPKAYRWLVLEIRKGLDDFAHERRATKAAIAERGAQA